MSRQVVSAVMDLHRRRFDVGIGREGKSGVVTMVQRSRSDLRLNLEFVRPPRSTAEPIWEHPWRSAAFRSGEVNSEGVLLPELLDRG
ncbi:MAG: hypothetical protein JW751_08815 [Polyangiaceae bacterium]|nr:hypothetical protein [Polyangiaceae bacterium]